MKINLSKNIEVTIYSGIMKFYIDGKYVDRINLEVVDGNASHALGGLVGVLRREGVIID